MLGGYIAGIRRLASKARGLRRGVTAQPELQPCRLPWRPGVWNALGGLDRADPLTSSIGVTWSLGKFKFMGPAPHLLSQNLLRTEDLCLGLWLVVFRALSLRTASATQKRGSAPETPRGWNRVFHFQNLALHSPPHKTGPAKPKGPGPARSFSGLRPPESSHQPLRHFTLENHPTCRKREGGGTSQACREDDACILGTSSVAHRHRPRAGGSERCPIV